MSNEQPTTTAQPTEETDASPLPQVPAPPQTNNSTADLNSRRFKQRCWNSANFEILKFRIFANDCFSSDAGYNDTACSGRGGGYEYAQGESDNHSKPM